MALIAFLLKDIQQGAKIVGGATCLIYCLPNLTYKTEPKSSEGRRHGRLGIDFGPRWLPDLILDTFCNTLAAFLTIAVSVCHNCGAICCRTLPTNCQRLFDVSLYLLA